MSLNTSNYSRFLERVSEKIDIPPGKYQDAVDRYKAVGCWLDEGNYPHCSQELSIYPQGSFRLGTVVRPIRDGIEADYDIDLVCELPIEKQLTNPSLVKMVVGNRIKEHETYRRMLDKEGKRCWTLKYSEEDGVGFHIDVLPAIPDPRRILDTSIAITNKAGNAYSWSVSNPKGYGTWFDSKNGRAFELVLREQKQSIQNRATHIYASVDDVPDQLIRTPLQRSIQLIKRHRDINFNYEQINDFSPLSIIITTLATYFYQSELDTYSSLRNIVNCLHAHTVLIEDGAVDNVLVATSPIKRTQDGKWYIGNPANPGENFAERWHEDNHARAKAFFSWVEKLKEDFVDIVQERKPEVIRKHLSTALGPAIVSPYLSLIVPVAIASVDVPKIHISNPAKPWRT